MHSPAVTSMATQDSILRGSPEEPDRTHLTPGLSHWEVEATEFTHQVLTCMGGGRLLVGLNPRLLGCSECS